MASFRLKKLEEGAGHLSEDSSPSSVGPLSIGSENVSPEEVNAEEMVFRTEKSHTIPIVCMLYISSISLMNLSHITNASMNA